MTLFWTELTTIQGTPDPPWNPESYREVSYRPVVWKTASCRTLIQRNLLFFTVLTPENHEIQPCSAESNVWAKAIQNGNDWVFLRKVVFWDPQNHHFFDKNHEISWKYRESPAGPKDVVPEKTRKSGKTRKTRNTGFWQSTAKGGSNAGDSGVY